MSRKVGGGGQLQTTKRPSCVPDHISTDDSVTTFGRVPRRPRPRTLAGYVRHRRAPPLLGRADTPLSPATVLSLSFPRIRPFDSFSAAGLILPCPSSRRLGPLRVREESLRESRCTEGRRCVAARVERQRPPLLALSRNSRLVTAAYRDQSEPRVIGEHRVTHETAITPRTAFSSVICGPFPGRGQRRVAASDRDRR